MLWYPLWGDRAYDFGRRGCGFVNARERAYAFLRGEKTDRIPVHPLVMQYAAQRTGVPFDEYCLDHTRQHEAMTRFSRECGLEYIHPAGFPYCEAGAYGLEVIYPRDGLPRPARPLIRDIERDLNRIRPLNLEGDAAVMNRVEGVALYQRTVMDELFVAGHCEGPLAEYTDLRGVSEGFCDLYDHEDEVRQALRIITDNQKRFIALQVEAGARCMSIGDAVCSQIGPDLYRAFVLPLHQELVDYVHSLGAVVKLHICGNITKLLPDLIGIGVDMIDLDHAADYREALPLLKKGQALCGNIDPVGVLYAGTPEMVYDRVREFVRKTQGRCIVASGCEVPKGTPAENYRAFVEATENL